MKYGMMRATIAVAALGALLAGCGDSQSDSGDPEGAPASSAAAPEEVSVETFDDLIAYLKDAGLCVTETAATESGALYNEPDTVTAKTYCDEQTTHALQVSGFDSVEDRDKALEEKFGDAYHYAGTGSNLWVIEVDYTEGREPLEQALGSQIEQL